MGYERDGRDPYREGSGRDERGTHRPEGGDYGFRGFDRERGERAGDLYQLQSYRGGEHADQSRGARPRDDDGRHAPPDRAYGQTNQYSQGLASPAAYGGSGGGYGSVPQAGSGHHFDDHYRNWRDRQMADLDRDYHEFRQENQRRFEEEFHSWRQKRQGQRDLLPRVAENMEVVGSDGQRIGTVDKVRGDRVVLNRRDPEAEGYHHSFPSSWIETIDEQRIVVNRSAADAMRHWMNDDRDRPLNDRGGGDAGPHYLDRAYRGTYEDR